MLLFRIYRAVVKCTHLAMNFEYITKSNNLIALKWNSVLLYYYNISLLDKDLFKVVLIFYF